MVQSLAANADDRELLGEKTFLREIDRARDELALGEIAAGAENDHDAGSGNRWGSA